MEYILDADWVINALAGKRGASPILRELRSSGIALSMVTIGELYEGAFGAPDPHRRLVEFREFFSIFTVLPLTDPIMERFGRLRHQLRAQGNLIPDFDLLIAATALELDLTVLTFNVRHFDRIPGLRLYPTTD
jgi:tRNA(fMet)-specific endonuclease VapC